MNIKHLFFCMLLIAFSSCSKPGYEKAIAEWVQTDSHGTWTDLKFELLEVLNRRRHRIGQPVLPEQQKRTIIRCHTESGKSPCLIQTVLFRLYGSRKKPESNGCHESHVPAP